MIRTFVRIVSLLIVCGAVISCATENIYWARMHNIPYTIVIVPSTMWNDTVAIHGLRWWNPDEIICFWKPPDTIFIHHGREFCLNHEVGHIREWMEGFPPHSKYAW